MKNICILGSTGSIGTQALEVIADHPDDFHAVSLCAHSNIDLLEKQAADFGVKTVAVMDETAAKELSRRSFLKVLSGIDGICQLASGSAFTDSAKGFNSTDARGDAQIVLNALSGNIGLKPTVAAIKSKKRVALANKEVLVSAGELVMKLAAEYGAEIIPVDSEHSAIFQCLKSGGRQALSKIYLTCSGGPFRGKTRKELEGVTIDDALAHPTWNMGKKITVDSATLMNKGLEVIEAKWLFDVDVFTQLEVVIHPQSVIHSMVEYADGSIIAQLGRHDMRVPIQYALSYPVRINNSFPKYNIFDSPLNFEKPDPETFGCLDIAFEAIKAGGTVPAMMNAANEEAVGLFIEKKIKFLDIENILRKAMESYKTVNNYTLEDVLEADARGREFVGGMCCQL